MNYRNQSTPDRILRATLGLVMLTAGWLGIVEGLWQIVLEVFGWVPLVTGLIGWSPLYALLGWSSRRMRPGSWHP